VWDAKTCEKIDAFQLQEDSRGVLAVGFSQCGRYVACVDDNDNHRVTIYNLERHCEILSLEGGKADVTNLAWSKRPDDLRFAVVGPKEIKFWHPADVTKKLSGKGSFQKAS
jgi:WD40 repeat protein